ncbi:hypothetical protein [Halobacteriovorax marinus]|uniref:hypothetical protein n=1 Tax=Halobacteriovorax marinus TaxID=97084 RepID=UPI003A91B9C6
MIFSFSENIVELELRKDFDYFLLNHRPSSNYVKIPSTTFNESTLRFILNSLNQKRSIFIISNLETIDLEKMYENTKNHTYIDSNYIFINRSIRSRFSKVIPTNGSFDLESISSIIKDL